MKKYEHKVVVSNEPDRLINSMSRHGWKVCAVIRLEDPVREIYFHRPLDTDALTVSSLTRKCAEASTMAAVQ